MSLLLLRCMLVPEIILGESLEVFHLPVTAGKVSPFDLYNVNQTKQTNKYLTLNV